MANLLVVDDDRDVANALMMFLKLKGHTVRWAADGEQGLLAVKEKFPDLILLDIDMPRLNGPEMAYWLIVQDSGRENIPILVVSGVNNLTEVAAQIGTPYLAKKPFKLNELERLTNQALEEKIPPHPKQNSMRC